MVVTQIVRVRQPFLTGQESFLGKDLGHQQSCLARNDAARGMWWCSLFRKVARVQLQVRLADLLG